MELTRRRTIGLLGAAATGSLAGCVSSDDGDGSPGENPPIDDLPQVDKPPYSIDKPGCGDTGDRDPLWLCENMAAAPSLAFEQEETKGAVLAGEGLTLDTEELDAQFYVALLTEEDHLDRLAENSGRDAIALVESTDFETQSVLVVQTGWGSGTITPHLKRIEETDGGVHAFGCYRRPCGGTDDITARTVVTQVDRPETLETARVSLTVDAETRVTFADGDVATVGDL